MIPHANSNLRALERSRLAPRLGIAIAIITLAFTTGIAAAAGPNYRTVGECNAARLNESSKNNCRGCVSWQGTYRVGAGGSACLNSKPKLYPPNVCPLPRRPNGIECITCTTRDAGVFSLTRSGETSCARGALRPQGGGTPPPATVTTPPAGRPVYLKSSDANLFLHARGGASAGHPQTLHACPRSSNHANCQWVFEPSPTRPGAWYVRSKGSALYLHSRGGSTAGHPQTLHACPKNKNYPNCQWIVESSPTRPGAVYLRSADAQLYLHARGGSTAGHPQTLHACPKGSNHANCQWVIQL